MDLDERDIESILRRALDHMVTRHGLSAERFIHQLTDSRGNDLYLSRLATYVSYLFDSGWAVGVQYREPIEDDNDVLFFAPGNQIELFSTREQFGG